MADNNNFQSTVESLFKGMDSFLTTKTVVGEAIHIGDNILLPLADVSFGIAAGAFAENAAVAVLQIKSRTAEVTTGGLNVFGLKYTIAQHPICQAELRWGAVCLKRGE